MAASGLWVKVAATLPRHYKTEALAKALNLPIHEVVGKLVSLWIYAVEFANTGLLTLDDIRRGFLSHDEPQDIESVMIVVRALRDCGMPHHQGFIEDLGDLPIDEASDDTAVQCWALHDWEKFSGTYQPDMETDEKGRRVLSYKKRQASKRGEIKKDKTTAGNTPDGGASAEKTAPNKEERASSDRTAGTLPHVETPLINNAGYDFSRTLDALKTAMSAKYD